MKVLVLCLLVTVAHAEVQCANGGTGPCVAYECPSGNTCISSLKQCCADSDLVLPGSTTNTSSTTAAPSTTTCVDKTKADGTSDCASMAYLCNDPTYYSLMTDQCPKTCNRCSASGGSSGSGSGTGSATSAPATNCVDLVGSNGVSDCPNRANLCNNAVYYDLMTQQCPKTCGRC